MVGSWRKLHNEELRNLFSSPNIIIMIKLRSFDGHGMWHAWGRRGKQEGFW
jgi:hypothetical protein